MKSTAFVAFIAALPLASWAAPTLNGGAVARQVPDGTLGSFCGGIAGFPCNEGLVCKLDGNYADAGGVCVKKRRN